jgi:hypothetical protein
VNNVAKILAAAVLALTVWIFVQIVQRPFFSDSGGTVWVVKTGEEPKEYGDQIFEGAKAAADKIEKKNVKPLTIALGNAYLPGDAPLTFNTRFLLRHRIMQALASGPVLGFISTGSSSIDSEIARVLTTLRVPLIITGATNMDVIPRDAPQTAVRLIGNNQKEAERIVEWIEDSLHKLGPDNSGDPSAAGAGTSSQAGVAVLYQPTAYGSELAALVARQASSSKIDVMPFPVANATAYVELGQLAQSYPFKVYVIIAFPPVLDEIVAAVSLLSERRDDSPAPAAGEKKPEKKPEKRFILLSDSGESAIHRKSASIWVCVPSEEDFRGLGRDAYTLLANLNSGPSGSYYDRLNRAVLNLPPKNQQGFSKRDGEREAGFTTKELNPEK